MSITGVMALTSNNNFSTPLKQKCRRRSWFDSPDAKMQRLQLAEEKVNLLLLICVNLKLTF